MLCLAFSEIQSRDFLAALPIPGLRSGSNAKAFFNPHLSGVIISATPIGAVLYYPRRASRQVLGFGLTIHGCPRKLIPAYPMCPGCLLSELCFAIPDDLHGKFADMIWLILAQASRLCPDRSRRTLEPALQVQGRRKSRQGWPIL